MSRNVKMSVFGFTNTGKTCYLLSMFEKMGIGYNGFKFCTSDERQYNLLSTAWEELRGDDGKLPDPSNTEMDKVKFLCLYGAHPIAEFDWQDYPGGNLKDPAKITEMIEQAKDSDCQMFFIPSNYFLEEDPSKLNECLHRFSNIIAKTIVHCAKEKRTYPSFAIVLSKFDLIPHVDRENVFYNIVRKLKEKFPELFSDGCVTMITGISLGENLGVVYNTDNGGRLGDGAIVDPLNMPLPILFAIRGYLDAELLKIEDESRTADGKIKYQVGKSRLWRAVVSGPQSVILARKLLADARQDRKGLQDRNDDFAKRINFIKQEIDKATYTNVYCNGELCSGNEGSVS